MGYIEGTLRGNERGFAFFTAADGKTPDMFIPNKSLNGALHKDRVLARKVVSDRGSSDEGEVVAILERGVTSLCGTYYRERDFGFVRPDDKNYFNDIYVPLKRSGGAKPREKVLVDIYKFPENGNPEGQVKEVLGKRFDLKTEELSIIKSYGYKEIFPAAVMKETDKIGDEVTDEQTQGRADYTDRLIVTIDGEDSRDFDDAVEVWKNENGNYMLGVHIADVSHYVKGNSNIDKEALKRGTSIYYADKVIPMLPKSLSNGICSLNPDEDRLAFSAVMKISSDGNLMDYTFKKSVIRSRVKGVYSEINKILDNTADEQIKKKYSDVSESIFIMKELADILTEKKDKRGAPQIETSESKLIIDENGICCNVVPRTRGASEIIIEEFMLMANESAAKLAREKNIPFVYRVHENPDSAKVDNLKQILGKMNVEYPSFTVPKPAHLAEILKNSYGSDAYPVINMMVLRTMAKAKYMNKPLGHFGLALADYSHFTSPIRRYPDLAIHRILSDLVSGKDAQWLKKRYESFALNASERSTNAEIKAMTVERDCEDCYKAEYMKSKTGMEFDGIISGVTEFGFYVELENTVEGLVHVNSMPDRKLDFDGMICLRDEISGMTFMTGDKVRVKCVRADVNSGNIDFELCQN
ncbi:MAG TPA: ribonuclease R [Ruminococcus sp.]|nr:ribonuclease R [Ruminococcus sp.]